MIVLTVDARDSREATEEHDIFDVHPTSCKNDLHVVLNLLDVISEVILAFFLGSCSTKPIEKSVQRGVVFLQAFKLGEQPAFDTLCRSAELSNLLDVLSNLLDLIPDLAFARLALLIECGLDPIENVVIGVRISCMRDPQARRHGTVVLKGSF